MLHSHHVTFITKRDTETKTWNSSGNNGNGMNKPNLVECKKIPTAAKGRLKRPKNLNDAFG